MKKKIIVLTMLLLIVSACGGKQGMTALADHKKELNQSMSTYYSLDLKAYKGEHFEAKVISLVKVPDQENAYYYSVAMAPLYMEPVCYSEVRLETAGEYKGNTGFTTEKTLSEVLNDRKYYEAVYGIEDEPGEYKALIMRGVIRFEDEKYTGKEYDAFVSDLILRIDYGSGSDAIRMKGLPIKDSYGKDDRTEILVRGLLTHGGQEFGPVGVEVTEDGRVRPAIIPWG